MGPDCGDKEILNIDIWYMTNNETLSLYSDIKHNINILKSVQTNYSCKYIKEQKKLENYTDNMYPGDTYQDL